MGTRATHRDHRGWQRGLSCAARLLRQTSRTRSGDGRGAEPPPAPTAPCSPTWALGMAGLSSVCKAQWRAHALRSPVVAVRVTRVDRRPTRWRSTTALSWTDRRPWRGGPRIAPDLDRAPGLAAALDGPHAASNYITQLAPKTWT
ncbi:hypothetical protein QJS66_12550 [Kocuria rhizophila]|nr:hypothetical protein QJS66_12550 [Kocuria rhizophila]